MSEEDIAILDAVDAHGTGVRVAFYRCERRLAHRIALVSRGEVQWVLTSVEGDSRQVFPPSPPLQQLATEQLDGGRAVVLLLGMAGRSHWSASAESQPSQRSVRFDVACRTRVADGQCLHSVYQIFGPWQWSAGASMAELVGPCGCLRVVASPAADGLTTLSITAGQLIVGPLHPGDALTYRWRYEVALTPHPDAKSP